jgi:hypothetical protein
LVEHIAVNYMVIGSIPIWRAAKQVSSLFSTKFCAIVGVPVSQDPIFLELL